MKRRVRHPIIRQLLDTTKKDDETFLKSLAALLRPVIPQQLSDRVAEESAGYGAAPPAGTAAGGLDKAPCTVGEALRQVLDSKGMSLARLPVGRDDAAKKLGISADRMQSLIEEMMPLTSATVPHVAQFFSAKYGLNALMLRQWLITGLRELEMKNTEHSSTRIAARKKKP